MTCNKCGAVLPVNATRCDERECRASANQPSDPPSNEPDGFAEYLSEAE